MKKLILLFLSSVVLIVFFVVPISAAETEPVSNPNFFEGESVVDYYYWDDSLFTVTHSPGFIPGQDFSCDYIRLVDGTVYTGNISVVTNYSYGNSSYQFTITVNGVSKGKDNVKIAEIRSSSSSSIRLYPFQQSVDTLSPGSKIAPQVKLTVTPSFIDQLPDFVGSFISVWGDLVAFVVDPEHWLVLVPVVAWLFVCGSGVFKNIPM